MSDHQQWVFASGNQGKLREVAQITQHWPVELMAQSHWDVSEADECGLSFIENALIKARHASRITRLPCIADDSGLSVDALNGAPGIYSSRYAGELATDDDNIDKLLDALKSVPDQQRQASFYCALVFVRHAEDPVPIVVTGQWSGRISHQRCGNGGFGYDPVFFLPALNCCSAELDKQQKNQISHRAQALSAIKPLLEQLVL
ncbi:MAG: RdgB/HAM1 family non-canonical purine NTP pyrophosphatase [bacterium]